MDRGIRKVYYWEKDKLTRKCPIMLHSFAFICYKPLPLLHAYAIWKQTCLIMLRPVDAYIIMVRGLMKFFFLFCMFFSSLSVS